MQDTKVSHETDDAVGSLKWNEKSYEYFSFHGAYPPSPYAKRGGIQGDYSESLIKYLLVNEPKEILGLHHSSGGCGHQD